MAGSVPERLRASLHRADSQPLRGAGLYRAPHCLDEESSPEGLCNREQRSATTGNLTGPSTRSHYDRRDIGEVLVGELKATELEAVHTWHHQIEENRARLVLSEERQCRRSVPCSGDEISFVHQDRFDDLSNLDIVVDDQDQVTFHGRGRSIVARASSRHI